MADPKHESASIERIETAGAWPFTTRRVVHAADGSTTTWSSRHHRKALAPDVPASVLRSMESLLAALWMPRKLNWWIGVIFALGSALFAAAAGLSLAPDLEEAWELGAAEIDALFFAGSIPFTTAAYLQLFQAANAITSDKGSAHVPRRTVLFGWSPTHPGWLSCALQFVGTLLFNASTFDALLNLDWFRADLFVWAPDMLGSILFLASGYLAYLEVCHAHWAWRPASLSWWVVFTNLIGCVGFMLSAPLAVDAPGGTGAAVTSASLAMTLIGALAFLAGSLLLLPEAAEQPEA